MKTRINLVNQNRNIALIAVATGLILLVPLVAMQFTDEVSWGPFDFATIGVLLFGAALVCERATRMVRDIKNRAAIGVAVVAVLLLVWLELAVGVLGTPAAGS